jgi:hypothetical protein
MEPKFSETESGKRYGTQDIYADLPEGHGFGEHWIDVWVSRGLGQFEVICKAGDQYAAMRIIDALCRAENREDR